MKGNAPMVGRSRPLAGLLVFVLPLGCAVAFGSAPACAGDDGFQPIWNGIGSIIGFGKDPADPIEYREHARLVLPPKTELPPPAASISQGNPAWPRDPDAERIRKAKEAKKNYVFVPPWSVDNRYPDTKMVITTSATAGQGPTKKCVADVNSGNCRQLHTPSFPNPLTWFGFGNKDENPVVGPEPDRDFLTDPPKGYRTGVGKASSAAAAAAAPTDSKTN